MIVVVITCVVVIAAMVFANLRLRARADEFAALARATADERDASRAQAVDAATDAAAARKERDDALERVNRSRRDAAQVANRLTAETAARAQAESELESTLRRLEEARDAGVGGLADLLWSLSVRRAETTWRLSIAVDPSAASPFAGQSDLFRTAAEIEVDAAREESGADIELEWTGDAVVESERAVVALAVLRDVVDALSTAAASTTVAVSCLDDGVELAVRAVDADGTPMEVRLPAEIESEPGRARIA